MQEPNMDVNQKHYCGECGCDCKGHGCNWDHEHSVWCRLWMHLPFWSALLSFVVVLLPGIIAKIMVITQESTDALVSSQYLTQQFSAWTLLVAMVLGIYGISGRGYRKSATRTLAMLALIVCLIRLLLPY